MNHKVLQSSHKLKIQSSPHIIVNSWQHCGVGLTRLLWVNCLFSHHKHIDGLRKVLIHTDFILHNTNQTASAPLRVTTTPSANSYKPSVKGMNWHWAIPLKPMQRSWTSLSPEHTPAGRHSPLAVGREKLHNFTRFFCLLYYVYFGGILCFICFDSDSWRQERQASEGMTCSK